MSSSSVCISSKAEAPDVRILIPSEPIELTEDNYLLWKSTFISILRAYDLLPLIQRTTKQWQSSTDQLLDDENWMKKDRIFLTWINRCLSSSLSHYSIKCTSGRQLWLQLEDRFIGDLKYSLRNLKDYYRSEKVFMKEYLERARSIADELEALGFPVDDGELVHCILDGLSERREYDQLVVSIRKRPCPISSQKLVSLLLCEPDRKRRNYLRMSRFLLGIHFLIVQALLISGVIFLILYCT